VTTDPAQTLALVGAEIRRIRRQRDISQEVAAAAAGLNLTTYGEIERGRRIGVRVDTLLRIADALGTPLWLILEAADRASASGGPARP
jgi:transcriptional regulator with XRE-family HTH domain